MNYLSLVLVLRILQTTSSRNEPTHKYGLVESDKNIKRPDDNLKKQTIKETEANLSLEEERGSLERENAIVVEYARDRPLMYSGHYDLVEEWTGKNKENGELKQNAFHFSPFVPMYGREGVELDAPYRRTYNTNVDYDINRKTNSKGGKKVMTVNEKEVINSFINPNNKNKQETKSNHKKHRNRLNKQNKVKKERNYRIKKSGKRRHVDGGHQGRNWQQQWSGEGIFRGVSRCVDIPRNMSLCSDIDYKVMRVPNLLQHDSLREIVEQSSYWTPLTRLDCHRDVQIFLCSLFAPVCLDQPVYPCQRTCEAVKEGCEASMREYNFDWPEFLECSKFPANTDLCVGLREEAAVVNSSRLEVSSNRHHGHECNMCGAGLNVETFIDHYCEADVVLKTKLHRVKTFKTNNFSLYFKNYRMRFIKGSRLAKKLVGRRRERMVLQTDNCNCTQVVRSLKRYIRKSKKQRKVHGGKNKQVDEKTDLNVDLPARNNVSKRSSAPTPPSSKRMRQTFLVMGRRLSGRWVVIFIHPLNKHSPSVTKALRLIHSNHRNICSSIS